LHNSVMLQLPVVGAIYKHWNVDEKGCKEFWEKVRTGHQEHHASPYRRLFEFLRAMRVHSIYHHMDVNGFISPNGKEIVVNGNIVVNACDQAFGLHKEGKKRKLKFDATKFEKLSV
jgi:hypothetical protein